jgi:hypothetical protein
MAKTRGRTRRPLPPSLVDDLTRLGFVYRESASEGLQFHIWQHKRWPSMELQVARANLAGSQEMVWAMPGSPAIRTEEEELVRRLEKTIDFRTNPNQFLADVEAARDVR